MKVWAIENDKGQFFRGVDRIGNVNWGPMPLCYKDNPNAILSVLIRNKLMPNEVTIVGFQLEPTGEAMHLDAQLVAKAAVP